MAVKNCIAGLVSVFIAASIVLLPAQASAAPRGCAAVGTGWNKLEDAIGEYTSPWFSTARGVNYERKIQFQALGGVNAERCFGGSATGQVASFFYASRYRLLECIRPGACKRTNWTQYTDRNSGPNVGFKYPDGAVGWDPFYEIVRTWPL